MQRALSSGRFGPYTIQAAIAAVHAGSPDPASTDWAQIVRLYDVLLQFEPSPVVKLNRAAAVAMRDGPQAGLELIDAILTDGELANYHLAHAARADFCRRLGQRRSPCVLRTCAYPDATGTRTPVSGTTAARTCLKFPVELLLRRTSISQKRPFPHLKGEKIDHEDKA